jgi:hypothetical protein
VRTLLLSASSKVLYAAKGAAHIASHLLVLSFSL